MAQGSGIKWRETDEKELHRIVRNFDAKINRQLKKNPAAIEWLPEKLHYRDVKAGIETRQEFNNLVKSLERFNRDKTAVKPVYSETGFARTRWEVHETKMQNAILNKQRARERAEAAPSPYKGNIATVQDLGLTPSKFDFAKISKADYVKKKESIQKQVKPGYQQKRLQLYKENYLKAIRSTLGPAGQKLYDYIKRLTPEQMRGGYYNNPVLSITFIYDPLAARQVAGEALAHWQKYLGDTVDPYDPEFDDLEDIL